jgi:hypothetical protein
VADEDKPARAKKTQKEKKTHDTDHLSRASGLDEPGCGVPLVGVEDLV